MREYPVRICEGLGVKFPGPTRQLVKILEPQTRREEALTDEPDLVLDLTLLQTRCRRAGDRVHEVMTAHLQEAAIIDAILTDEDRLHCRLHVVVDAALACALEQSEGSIVSVEHHLLRLAWVDPHEQHAAVTKPDMGSLHSHRHAAEQDDFVTPVELVGFTRSKAQRDVGRRHRLAAPLGPPSGVAAHGTRPRSYPKKTTADGGPALRRLQSRGLRYKKAEHSRD
jgi:hypothetical protein